MRERPGGGGIRGGGPDCRICFGGVIGRKGLEESSPLRFCRLLVCFHSGSLCYVTDGCHVDAEVMGLWANIESQIYKALGPGKTASVRNGTPNRQETGQANVGLDGYQREFVANIER